MTTTARDITALRRVLVVGFARTGQAVAKVLKERGIAVIAIDDSEAVVDATLDRSGIEVRRTPERDALRTLVHGVDLVVASPGVPPSHPVFSAANRENIVSEIELASWMIRPPIVAVTGTNGKTTVVELVSAMLRASGRRSEATGNIGVPLISVVGRDDLDVVVAEVSSFQLAAVTDVPPGRRNVAELRSKPSRLACFDRRILRGEGGDLGAPTRRRCRHRERRRRNYRGDCGTCRRSGGDIWRRKG